MYARDFPSLVKFLGPARMKGSIAETPVYAVPSGTPVKPGRSPLPADYILQPTGAIGRLLKRGIRLGCDVSKLPVPPPSTLQPYNVPKQPPKVSKK